MALLHSGAALVLAFALGSFGAPLARAPGPGLDSRPTFRTVRVNRVEAVVPSGWEVRPIASPASHRVGLRASGRLAEWASTKSKALGLEAYWVDAAEVGVPSDYYYLAARGPVMERLLAQGRCHTDEHRVLLDDRPKLDRRVDSPGNFMATATGTCRGRHERTRWTSFVAAPGFGPVRDLGIPESGLYYVLVVVEDGPGASEHMQRMLSLVRFGDTPVSTFIETGMMAAKMA